MSKILYNQEQVQELLNNNCVKNCTPKSIIFNNDFKSKAVELREQWIGYTEIFRKYNFPIYVVNSNVPECSLKRWRKNVLDNWEDCFIQGKKWRKKWSTKVDSSQMNKDEYIKYLETKVAYLTELSKANNIHYP